MACEYCDSTEIISYDEKEDACLYISHGQLIWERKGWNWCMDINYCPYCGEKLGDV